MTDRVIARAKRLMASNPLAARKPFFITLKVDGYSSGGTSCFLSSFVVRFQEVKLPKDLMKAVLHDDGSSVAMRLQQLGLSEAALLQAVMAGYLAKTNCTENHPPLFPPIAAWSESVRTLRDILRPEGWTRFNDQNSPKTINPDGSIALIVSTGNEATGNPSVEPATTSSKGPTTADAIEVNRSMQLDLPGFGMPISLCEESDGEKISTWILLTHHAKNELRAELSLPLAAGPDGRVSVWKERIILRAQPINDEVAVVTPPAQPDIDISVRRKA